MRGVKRAGVFVAALLVLLAALASCSGNYEIDNGFFIRNRDVCVVCGRSFTVIDGSAGIFSRPGGRTVGDIDAGTVLTVEYYYTDDDGEVWGVTAEGGWLRMDGLELVYDAEAFYDSHRDEISDYSGGSLSDGTRYLWTYPCSGEISGTDSSASEEQQIGSQYTDAEGRLWVYLEKSGGAGGWICADAPYDDTLEAVDYGVAVLTYIKPTEPAGLWDRLPHAPYAIGGVVLIILFETFMFVRKRRRDAASGGDKKDASDNNRSITH